MPIQNLRWENLEEREIILTRNALKQEQRDFDLVPSLLQTLHMYSPHLPNTPVPFARDSDDRASFLSSFVYFIYPEYNVKNNKFLSLGGSTALSTRT